MYHVVIGVDRDEDRARSQARTVADLPDADEAVHATLVHIFSDNPEGASVDQLAAVRRARETLREAGVEVELAETSGDPASELLDEAGDRDADAICLAGRKRSPAGKAVFGSVTQTVILEADRPVIVAPKPE